MPAWPRAAAPDSAQGSATTRHVGLPLAIPVQVYGILASEASIGKHSETFSQAGLKNVLPGDPSRGLLLLQIGQGSGVLFFVYCFGHQKSTACLARKCKR